MKTIFLTKKQVEAKKKHIDKIILEEIPIEAVLTFFIVCTKKKKKITKRYNWGQYEKTIDKEVAQAKKVLKSRIELYSIAEGKKKLLDKLLRDGIMVTENKKYILKE